MEKHGREFFMMFALNPMGIFRYKTAADVLKIAGGILIVPATCLLAHGLASALGRRSHKEPSRTIGMSLAWSFALSLLIIIAEFVYNTAIYDVELTPAYIRFYVWCSLLLAPLPILVSSLFARNLRFVPAEACAPASKLLRTTMKQAADDFAGFPFIIRCHRAFFVNVNHVSGVEGNSQGYRLSVSGCADTVPVSRAYTKTVRELLCDRI